jgi:hypothetical protein
MRCLLVASARPLKLLDDTVHRLDPKLDLLLANRILTRTNLRENDEWLARKQGKKGR